MRYKLDPLFTGLTDHSATNSAIKTCVVQSALYNSVMSKASKLIRKPLDKISSKGITVKKITRQSKAGKQYTTYRVQGWREDGKWQRKQFTDKLTADLYASEKQGDIHNQGCSRRLLSTTLSEEQIRDAEQVTEKLGSTYSLLDAVNYFLENHRDPDLKIYLSVAIKNYLDAMEREGVMLRTRKSVLAKLLEHVGDSHLHEVTKYQIKSYLDGIRMRDGITKAKLKTWNNYKNDINHFFKWCCEDDPETNRPCCTINPVDGLRSHSSKKVAKQKSAILTTDVYRLKRGFSSLMNWRDGCMVKYFALAYFAGIRPDGELQKLSKMEGECINLNTGNIRIPASISKTSEDRDVDITPNLRRWLEAYEGAPIVPTNFSRLVKRFRKSMRLSHDETRHSFISYHVAAYRSIGDASLQAGNSEYIVRKHYKKLHSRDEGAVFFSIVPDMEKMRAVIS